MDINKKLNEGDIICDQCHGYGKLFSVDEYGIECKWCKGEGTLNWIENVFGKHRTTHIEICDSLGNVLVKKDLC